MTALVLVEVTLASIVFCADSLTDCVPRRPLQRIVRSLFWMVTLLTWFSHRNLAKLGRFGAIVWFLVTTGWLLSLEYDRSPSGTVFLLAAEATMAFLVHCVDSLSGELVGHPVRRVLRAVFWPKAVVEYMQAEDSVKIAHASLTIWLLLTTGWLLSLQHDRLTRPLAGL